ncbi:MAG: metallophosphoesterase family protein [Solirubrobacteraceae bacterium]|nr:metallophosphoesterase family protein [Solirubrobacteraceae bacterium]
MLALLYDVHGNLAALDAVLADAEAAGTDRWVVGGDVSAFGGWPVETLARLRELPDALWLRGNHERWALEPDAIPDVPLAVDGRAAWVDALGGVDAPDVRALHALPAWQPLPAGEAWHGSPRSDMDGFLPDPVDGEADLLEGRTPGLLVVGHTHRPVHRSLRRPDGGATTIFNPGSVGLPFDGDPRAAYGLLHPDGRLEHRRVAYDVDRAVARQRERWGDASWSRTVARTLRDGHPATDPEQDA